MLKSELNVLLRMLSTVPLTSPSMLALVRLLTVLMRAMLTTNLLDSFDENHTDLLNTNPIPTVPVSQCAQVLIFNKASLGHACYYFLLINN